MGERLFAFVICLWLSGKKNLELSWKTLGTPRKVFKFSEFPHLISKDSKVDPITLQIQDALVQNRY